ncbi:hypothetical protein SCA6_007497 [Theobroma cacao]
MYDYVILLSSFLALNGNGNVCVILFIFSQPAKLFILYSCSFKCNMYILDKSWLSLSYSTTLSLTKIDWFFLLQIASFVPIPPSPSHPPNKPNTCFLNEKTGKLLFKNVSILLTDDQKALKAKPFSLEIEEIRGKDNKVPCLPCSLPRLIN